jgi:hypothetical protein
MSRTTWGGAPFGRAALFASFVAATALSVLAAREVVIGRDEVSESDAASAHGNWLDAIRHARNAAQASSPGSPWPSRARRRLEAMGLDAERRGDDDTALLAYGSLRSAALATRGIGSNSARWRAAAEDGLSRVAGRRSDVPHPRDARSSMLAALQHEEAPPAGTMALLMASALALTAGLGHLAWVDSQRAGVRLGQTLVAGGILTFAAALLMN